MDSKTSHTSVKAAGYEAAEESTHISSIGPSQSFDDTYQLYKAHDAADIDPREAKRILRKIDYHILPILMMTYMLQYLDKSSINFASVYGLKEGTGLQGQDYSWLGSCV